ncbi:MAG TPA: hypothetical protein VGQ03_02065 [Nitrososphaera sp.]|nr:hypothetical protein [Nitrososphaera sp.]
MPSSILGAIIRELSASSCRRILSSDGVTSAYLTVNSTTGLFGSVSVDVQSARKSVQEIGDAASTAKNLDEYQFLICSLVPSLADSNPSKLELQKYRVAILAAFSTLVNILNEKQQELGEWSRNAKWLVEETSEAYLQAKSNIQTHPLRHKEMFDYFGVSEATVVSAIRTFYGLQ